MFVTKEQVAKGLDDLPSIPINTQASLRWQRKLKYTKIGKEVMYKKEWIQEYVEANTREVERGQKV